LRWSAKRKAEAVLQHLRGVPLDKISFETALPIPCLEEWRAQALLSMEQALQVRETAEPAQQKLDEANRRLGDRAWRTSCCGLGARGTALLR
jgi:hypothetical protein